MSNRFSRRAESLEQQSQLPIPFLAGMLTACAVTLLGVYSWLDPFVVLVRATVSSVAIWLVLSLGIGVVKLANSRMNNSDDSSSIQR